MFQLVSFLIFSPTKVLQLPQIIEEASMNQNIISFESASDTAVCFSSRNILR